MLVYDEILGSIVACGSCRSGYAAEPEYIKRVERPR
jgi:hypothetical protein